MRSWPLQHRIATSTGVALLLGSGLLPGAWGEVTLPPLPTDIVLAADGGSALHTERVPAELPFGVGLARIDFTVGFATREVPAPGEFLDALSVSLEPPGTDALFGLLTSDARGDLWSPDDPDGAAFPPGILAQQTAVFPADLGEGWTRRVAFAVSLTLPMAWQNCEAGLWLDLFDNRAGERSLVFLRDLRLTARDPFFLLESSATPLGPYAAEMNVSQRGDPSDGAFDVWRGGVARFFRLRADSTVTLRVLGGTPDAWRFGYEFPEPQPVLESATRVVGPYAAEPTAVLGAGRREFRVAAGGPQRFYRVRANVRTAVTGLRLVAGNVVVDFEYRPQVFSLQSSAQPCGPYADDPHAAFDTTQQTITVSRTHLGRFFRLAHSRVGELYRLAPVQELAGRWWIPYRKEARP